MDYLCELPNDAARRKALATLPPDLNATYERILKRVNEANVEVQKLVQKTLRWIVKSHSYPNLEIDALCEAISIDFGDTSCNAEAIPDVADVLRWCSSLVRKSTHGDHLELAHFTVKEYLLQISRTLDSDFAAYGIDEDREEIELAMVCLTYLSFEDFDHCGTTSLDSTKRRLQRYPFRAYAVNQWAYHAADYLGDPQILALAGKIFNSSKPNTLVTWAQDRILAKYVDYGYTCGLDLEHIQSGIAEANALHFAVMECLPELCSWLVESGCDVNRKSAFGTPLYCTIVQWRAAEKSYDLSKLSYHSLGLEEQIMSILLEAGADPNLRCDVRIRMSPLLIAVKCCSLPLALRLLHGGALLDNDCLSLLEGDDNWDTKSIHQILERAMDKNVQGKDRDILRRLALKTKDSSLAAIAQERDAKYEEDPSYNADRETVLLTVAEFGQLDAVLRLLEDHSLNINFAEEHTGLTALHQAAKNDHVHIVEALLNRGADPDQPDCKGRVVLHHAVNGSMGQCLSFLLQRNPDISPIDIEGCSSLHLASERDDGLILKILLSQSWAGLDINGQTLKGKTPLMLAAGHGNAENVKLLLSQGCDPTIVDHDGWTVAHYATEAGHRDVLMVLRDTEVNWNSQAVALVNDDERQKVTALHLAATLEDSSVLEYLLGEISSLDIDSVTNEEETALLIAVWSWHPRNVSQLLSKGANMTIMDMVFGFCPIHLAARFGEEHMILTMLDHGCDIELPNRDGLTPELVARKHGHADLASILLTRACKQGMLYCHPSYVYTSELVISERC